MHARHCDLDSRLHCNKARSENTTRTRCNKFTFSPFKWVTLILSALVWLIYHHIQGTRWTCFPHALCKRVLLTHAPVHYSCLMGYLKKKKRSAHIYFQTRPKYMLMFVKFIYCNLIFTNQQWILQQTNTRRA